MLLAVSTHNTQNVWKQGELPIFEALVLQSLPGHSCLRLDPPLAEMIPHPYSTDLPRDEHGGTSATVNAKGEILNAGTSLPQFSDSWKISPSKEEQLVRRGVGLYRNGGESFPSGGGHSSLRCE